MPHQRICFVCSLLVPAKHFNSVDQYIDLAVLVITKVLAPKDLPGREKSGKINPGIPSGVTGTTFC